MFAVWAHVPSWRLLKEMQRTRPPHSFTYVLCVDTGVQVLTAIVTSESRRASVGQYVRHSSHIDEHEGMLCNVTKYEI